MDRELKDFCEKVSDKIVFEKFGKWYRVFLYKKTSRTFGIKKVVIYNWTINPNEKYNGIFNYALSLDYKSVFYLH